MGTIIALSGVPGKYGKKPVIVSKMCCGPVLILRGFSSLASTRPIVSLLRTGATTLVSFNLALRGVILNEETVAKTITVSKKLGEGEPDHIQQYVPSDMRKACTICIAVLSIHSHILLYIYKPDM